MFPKAPYPATDLYRMQVRDLRGYAMFIINPHGDITSWNAGGKQSFEPVPSVPRLFHAGDTLKLCRFNPAPIVPNVPCS